MPVSDYDVNPSNSELIVGPEIEYPRANSEEELLSHKGRDSSSLESEVTREGGLETFNTYPEPDPSVGLEVNTDEPLPLGRLQEWYRAVINEVEGRFGTLFQPSGDIRGNTAGLHIHISPLSEGKARRLYEMSQTEWMQVFMCTSVTENDVSTSAPVFRGGSYCNMDNPPSDPGGHRYDCVNHRGGEHWEWRLPEPMLPEHTELVSEFLRLFEQDPDAAATYAKDLLQDGDERITSIRRAEEIGLVVRDMNEILRTPFEDSESFFHEIEEDPGTPKIYRASLNDGEYYLFDTELSSEIGYEVSGTSFTASDILRADTLECVEDSELENTIERAYEEYCRETRVNNENENTDYLKEIVKKKNE